MGRGSESHSYCKAVCVRERGGQTHDAPTTVSRSDINALSRSLSPLINPPQNGISTPHREVTRLFPLDLCAPAPAGRVEVVGRESGGLRDERGDRGGGGGHVRSAEGQVGIVRGTAGVGGTVRSICKGRSVYARISASLRLAVFREIRVQRSSRHG